MTTINATEISSLIKNKIDGVDLAEETKVIGHVLSVKDGVVVIYGLTEALYGEMLVLPGDVKAIALNLDKDSVAAVVLGDYSTIREGDEVRCTGKVLETPVGEALLGRVVDALGTPIDGKGDIKTNKSMPVERVAPGVIARQSVSQPLQTGIKPIDIMVIINSGGKGCDAMCLM